MFFRFTQTSFRPPIIIVENRVKIRTHAWYSLFIIVQSPKKYVIGFLSELVGINSVKNIFVVMNIFWGLYSVQ